MKSIGPEQEHLQRPIPRHPVIKPRAANVPGVKGTLPLRPGEVILTEFEKRKLARFGWKEGDPLPGNITELMAKEKRGVTDDLRTAQPFKNKQIFKAPEPIDISELSDERQAELQAHLQKFKEMAPQIEAAARNQDHIATLPPDIQKAIRESGGVEVVDSSEPSSDPIKAMQRKIDIAEGRVEADDGTGLEEDDEPKQPESQTGLDVDRTKCPRCNWDLSFKPIEPSTADKQVYVACILGDKLFEKPYSLFGGKLVVGFRQLTTTRSDMVFYQIAHEIRSNLLGEDSYRKVMLYRMCLAINHITVGNHKPVDVGNAVDAFVEEEASETKIGDLLPIILSRLQQTELLKSESVWRAVREAFGRFNTLLDDLDARADNPDFWNATEA